MRPLRILYLVFGLGLLAVVLLRLDLGEVGGYVAGLGVPGALAIVGVFLVAFVVDTAAWQLMLPSARLNGAWLYRLWKVRMVGEALNALVAMGGEPVKAALLKKYDAIGYRESAASLIIAKTVYLLALIVFSAIGLVLMIEGGALAPEYELMAGVGLGALGLGVGGFFAVQRLRVTSSLLRWAAGFRAGRPLARILGHMRDIDDHFQRFYARQPRRFHAALWLALLNWGLGAYELYLIMYFLGHPVTWTEVWIMETAVQLVRAGTFFIPGHIGANEVGLVLIVGALTGQPSLGLAAAVVRRGREALWIAWGCWLGWLYSRRPTPNEPAAAKATTPENS